MGYIRSKTSSDEYSGESFTRTIRKKDELWGANDEANYKLYDQDGKIVSSGSLVKSGDLTSMAFVVPKNDTAKLVGTYKLLVELTDSSDDRISDIVAEYELKYKAREA